MKLILTGHKTLNIAKLPKNCIVYCVRDCHYSQCYVGERYDILRKYIIIYQFYLKNVRKEIISFSFRIIKWRNLDNYLSQKLLEYAYVFNNNIRTYRF